MRGSVLIFLPKKTSYFHFCCLCMCNPNSKHPVSINMYIQLLLYLYQLFIYNKITSSSCYIIFITFSTFCYVYYAYDLYFLSLLSVHKNVRSRNVTPEANRLLLTMKYLPGSESQQSFSFSLRIGKSTVSKILRETCETIWKVLKKDYLKVS